MAARNPLDAFTFDTEFPFVDEQAGIRRWSDPSGGGGLTLHFFGIPPNIECPLEEAALHAFYLPGVLRGGAGLVELSKTTVAGVASVRMVIKAVMDQQTGRGRVYVGSFTLPFRDFSFVVKVQYFEQGTTGVREALVIDRLLASGELEIEPDESEASSVRIIGPARMRGWQTGEGPPHLAPNRAEDPAYDTELPNHPLSLVRQRMAEIQASAALAGEMLQAPPFVYPPVQTGRLRGLFDRLRGKR